MTTYIRWCISTNSVSVKRVEDIVEGCAIDDSDPTIIYYEDEAKAREEFATLVSDVGRFFVTEHHLIEEVWWKDESDPDDEGDFLADKGREISPMPEKIYFDHTDYKRINDEWVPVSLYGRTAKEFSDIVEAAGNVTGYDPELVGGIWYVELAQFETVKETKNGFIIEE